MKYLFIVILSFLINLPTMAEELAIPRFAALKSDTVYMRSGPGERFPIEWVYKRKNFPVKIIDTFEHWYKIEDINQTQGWVHKRMLSDKKTALTKENEKTSLYQKENLQSKVLAYFDGQAIVQILKCETDSLFCQVKYNDLKGYILKNNLFGIYPNEEIRS